jgi:hypothetical protein
MSNATLNAPRWFAAGPGGTYSSVAASRRTVPVLHAKEPGGTRTRCGLPALRWSISWALPFDDSADWACPACGDVLSKSSTARA